MTLQDLNSLKTDLSVKAKNGMDFTLSASIIWLGIAYIWTLSARSYDKSVLTFIAGAFMLPLAFGLSKVLKTQWNTTNPLESLGLWLNFAQLFYFPFLVFTLMKMPDYFVMVYVIITGAHFFPYAWYYKTNLYAIFAGIISVGALFLGLTLESGTMFYLPAFMSTSLIVLTGLLYLDSQKKRGTSTQQFQVQ